MRVIIQILKFIIYCVITAAEFVLMLLLDIVKQMKKPFN
jgi:hypothetical protein